jgi:hypothetical protein
MLKNTECAYKKTKINGDNITFFVLCFVICHHEMCVLFFRNQDIGRARNERRHDGDRRWRSIQWHASDWDRVINIERNGSARWQLIYREGGCFHYCCLVISLSRHTEHTNLHGRHRDFSRTIIIVCVWCVRASGHWLTRAFLHSAFPSFSSRLRLLLYIVLPISLCIFWSPIDDANENTHIKNRSLQDNANDWILSFLLLDFLKPFFYNSFLRKE